MVTTLVSAFSNIAYTATQLASVLVYCGVGMRHRERGGVGWGERCFVERICLTARGSELSVLCMPAAL